MRVICQRRWSDPAPTRRTVISDVGNEGQWDTSHSAQCIIREGMIAKRILDGIVRNKYADDPGKRAAWLSASQKGRKRTGSDMQFWRHRPASAKAALKCWYLPSLRSRGSAYLQNPIEHQKAQDLLWAFSFVLQRIQSGTGSNMGKRCRAYDTTIQADRGHIQHFLANHLPGPRSRSPASKSF